MKESKKEKKNKEKKNIDKKAKVKKVKGKKVKDTEKGSGKEYKPERKKSVLADWIRAISNGNIDIQWQNPAKAFKRKKKEKSPKEALVVAQEDAVSTSHIVTQDKITLCRL